MPDDYTPFPEKELLELAAFHDSVAGSHGERSYLRSVHEERAKACRDALASQVALRERCLIAEMELGQERLLHGYVR
jgi:hypothetical protein